ncbi:TMEM165/GDT1 family protein [Propionispora sp. 2/2-37]|uniref:TMEM165/GDT1 family protein n=1 Tax=Propionispora sp. 2/2-37 TaxID=1677858 RepID=UPI0006BB6B12|nr:TMEM165/GDT1 family protein [Propionispora sp. 2/2-37]
MAFLTSLVFVILAEMGDKTQLLAMAFATRYRWQTVMWGVLAATVLNHWLAVMAGTYITQFIPMNYVRIAAAAAFVLFGLWTIRGDELDGEDKATKYGPFWTVATAFFIAEMGDKTQLATVTLAAQFDHALPVWLGTTMGMMVADGFGIIVGIVMGKHIPERAVQWFAAVSFICFGLFGLYQSLPGKLLTAPIIVGALIMLTAAVCLLSRMRNGPPDPTMEK